MNAGSPQRIGSTEFLRKVEEFRKVCATGKASSAEVNAFYEIIKQGRQSSGKGVPSSASVGTDLDLNKKILTALSALKVDLGKSKTSIESDAKKSTGAIPYPVLVQAIDDVERYVKEEQKTLQQVKGKPSAGRL